MQSNDRKNEIEEVWAMRPRILAYLLNRGASRDDAEDLATETCLKTVLKWGMFNPQKGRLESWMIRIAHNLHVSLWRRRRFEVHAVGTDYIDEV